MFYSKELTTISKLALLTYSYKSVFSLGSVNFPMRSWWSWTECKNHTDKRAKEKPSSCYLCPFFLREGEFTTYHIPSCQITMHIAASRERSSKDLFIVN